MLSAILILLLLLLVIHHFKSSYKYWTKKGIFTIPPKIPFGNTNTILPKGFAPGISTKEYYDHIKNHNEKFGGIFFLTKPHLVLVDPEYIKDVTTTDFQHFTNRGIYTNKTSDPIGAHLFATDGSDWRNLRIKLTPTFTTGKIKLMFQLVLNCAKNMEPEMEKYDDIDVKEIFGKFSTDVVGSCAFGIDCNSFLNPEAEFQKIGKLIFTSNFRETLKMFVIDNFPDLGRKLGLAVNKKVVQDFFLQSIRDTIKAREKYNVTRSDFLQILMDLQKSGNFSTNDITAQAFGFFVGGSETASTALTFALYELSRNKVIQKKLREEIRGILDQNCDTFNYEHLSQMTYLDQVINETLRLYPSLATIVRQCSKEYTLKNTNIILEKGTKILIPVYGLHMDPEYYPNPTEFKPERFSPNNFAKIKSAYLPFGDGPRNCIAFRFSLMQLKIGLASVISKFEFSSSPKTKAIRLDSSSFVTTTLDTIYLKAERI